VSSGRSCRWSSFADTDRVRRDQVALAALEATQAAEVPFALAFEAILLGPTGRTRSPGPGSRSSSSGLWLTRA